MKNMNITNTELSLSGEMRPPCFKRDVVEYAPENLDMVTIIEYDESGCFRFGLNVHTYVTGVFGRDPDHWC